MCRHCDGSSTVSERDLSDARLALVEPTLTAGRRARTERALAFGRPPEHELRDLLDAIL